MTDFRAIRLESFIYFSIYRCCDISYWCCNFIFIGAFKNSRASQMKIYTWCSIQISVRYLFYGDHLLLFILYSNVILLISLAYNYWVRLIWLIPLIHLLVWRTCITIPSFHGFNFSLLKKHTIYSATSSHCCATCLVCNATTIQIMLRSQGFYLTRLRRFVF